MNKRYLLATAAAAVLASSGQAQARDLYVSVLGGGNWWQSQSRVTTDDSTVFHFDADTGFVLGGAVGVHVDRWVQGLRLELEASYRRNKLAGHWSSSDTEVGALTGHVSTFALMANVWYDIDCGSRFKPYVGGGAGWARSHFDAVRFTSSGNRTSGTTSVEASGFAWQLGAGVNYEVMPGVDLGLGYRFVVDPKLHLGGEGSPFDTRFSLDNQSHSVELSLTIDIDS
jgi:OOP family OmpA-OmpF porin